MKIRASRIAILVNSKWKSLILKFSRDGQSHFLLHCDERVDFRDLIREYAAEFNTRIEMRQIGLRQEAARLRGL